MKTITKILSASFVLLFANNSFGQATDQATATATIIAPISIEKKVDMNFGNIAVTSTGGTVVLAAASGANIRSVTGGVTLPTYDPGTVTAAKFTVSGADDYTYSITLPTGQLTLTHSAGTGTGTMTAETFTHSLPTDDGGELTNGSQDVYVGATLNVGANQAAGIYTSGNFNVTVNYN